MRRGQAEQAAQYITPARRTQGTAMFSGNFAGASRNLRSTKGEAASLSRYNRRLFCRPQ
jgi:hypothetical protein